jgi:hypothetical protein
MESGGPSVIGLDIQFQYEKQQEWVWNQGGRLELQFISTFNRIVIRKWFRAGKTNFYQKLWAALKKT